MNTRRRLVLALGAGALANGYSPEEIREVLLLVAFYCGIPAANKALRIALETITGAK